MAERKCDLRHKFDQISLNFTLVNFRTNAMITVKNQFLELHEKEIGNENHFYVLRGVQMSEKSHNGWQDIWTKVLIGLTFKGQNMFAQFELRF